MCALSGKRFQSIILVNSKFQYVFRPFVQPLITVPQKTSNRINVWWVSEWTFLEAVEGSSRLIAISAKKPWRPKNMRKSLCTFWLSARIPFGLKNDIRAPQKESTNLSVLAEAQKWSCISSSLPETPGQGFLGHSTHCHTVTRFILPCPLALKKNRYFLACSENFHTGLSNSPVFILPIKLHTQQCFREYLTHSHGVTSK